MKTSFKLPVASSSDLLEALGLERRRSLGTKLIFGVGLAAVGALFGAAAVVWRGGVTKRQLQNARLVEDLIRREAAPS